jgi:hypothetical protein
VKVALIVSVALNVALLRAHLSRTAGAGWPATAVNAGAAFAAAAALMLSYAVMANQLT